MNKISRVRPHHLLAAVAPLLLLTAGCHHRTQSASTPPPAPAGSQTTSRNSRHTHTEIPDDPDAAVVGDTPNRTPRTARSPGNPPSPGPALLHGKPFDTAVGLASWYGPPYAGRKGADGTVYDQNAMTAAHLTLPLGTVVRVTNLTNGESVVVRITDRGPFVRGRIIDLSLAAAKSTGVYRAGVVKVRVEAFDAPPLAPNVPPGGRWCVQIGAFPTEVDAQQEKADLLQRYIDAKVIAFQGPTGWWVRINPKLADKTHAAEVADSIHLPDEAQPYLTRTD